MEGSNTHVVFRLDEQRYGLFLSAVDEILRAVEITPVPKSPAIVLGLINVRGKVVPVLDIRKRFRLPDRAPQLSDHLILARTSTRSVALVADAVIDVRADSDSQILDPDQIVPGLEYVEGVVKLDDGLILIHDLNRFLSLDEQTRVDSAIRGLRES